MNFCYKKCTAKPYSFLVNDTTLPSDNPLRFSRKILERMLKTIMTKDDKIKDQKAAKISALLSGKIDEYEYLTDEEILSLIKVK